MDLEAELRQTTRDVSTLANTVTRIATIVENSEKRHDSDMEAIKSALMGIKDLNDKVSASAGMKDDIAQIREDLRVTGHDVKTALNAIAGLPVLQEKITEAKTDFAEKLGGIKTDLAVEKGRIDAIEKRNATIDGGVSVFKDFGKVLWAVFGAAILAGINFILTKYYGGGAIGGE